MTGAHHNPDPRRGLDTIADLRRAMTASDPRGDRYLDHLLDGDYFAGKGVFVDDDPEPRAAYAALVAANPHLATESPYGPAFRRDRVRTRGDNRILVERLDRAPDAASAAVAAHRRARAGGAAPLTLFAGGPAAKIAALVAAGPARDGRVAYALDGAEQSNESGSASYEHVNHANALNAEFDNTGFGILLSAVRRAVFGEPDPEVALGVGYHKVDLWPRAVALRDLPIYLHNEAHGLLQRLRALLGATTDHTRSRRASLISTAVLSEVERRLDIALRLDNRSKRAVFLYFSTTHHAHSLVDNRELAEQVGLAPRKLSAEEIVALYGPDLPGRIVSADLFPENACIRHGFDRICTEAMAGLGVELHLGRRVAAIYFEPGAGAGPRAAAVALDDVATGERRHLALDRLGLSLGPTATFHYGDGAGRPARIADHLALDRPVPYQTIATGLSAQVLFRIVDAGRARDLPFTGMKQTHFVEIGRTDRHLLMKLTCGGVIGLPVYSRSYGLSALASLFSVIGPGCGLAFERVVCAWPCARGVNGPNNGQVVRLADNAAVRFGEGGTGMSKMGSNAQTLFDLTGLAWPFGPELTMPRDLYAHTVVDRRRRLARRLGSG